jgi:hypothetical protein
MLFEQRFRVGVQGGAVTVTFRRWKRRQAVAGRRYRTAVGMIAVDAVDVVTEEEIRGDDVGRAGYPTREALLADLRGTPELPIYRVAFRAVAGPDPRDELAADATLDDTDVAELDRRLARLDRAGRDGPWTRQTLSLIEAHPARRAGDLAEMVGREREPFKLDVRKLKNLGLTISLDVGYRLSPRGEAYLRHGRD